MYRKSLIAEAAVLILLCTICSCSTGVRGRLHGTAPVYNVLSYGAVGDGVTMDTKSIQRTMDAASAGGGGIVLLPSGHTFLSGLVCVSSNTAVEVQPNASLVGSHRRIDYPYPRDQWYLLLFQDAENVSLRGGGEINGQAEAYVYDKNPVKYRLRSWNRTDQCTNTECRPRLVGFIRTRNVQIHDVKLIQPAYWCMHLVDSVNVTVRNVTIFGDPMIPNNDGMDIDGGKDIAISNCTIFTGDDAICPKTHSMSLENLSVRGCFLHTKSSAVKLGSGSQKDFRNLTFSDLVIHSSHRGVGIQLRDQGGNAEDILFRNINMTTQLYDITWWGMGEPIYLTSIPRESNATVGSIRNVRFENIRARSEGGIFVAGYAGSEVSDITFENVTVEMDKWSRYPLGYFHDYRPSFIGLLPHNISLLYLEHAKGVALRNVELSFGSNPQWWWDTFVDTLPRTVSGLVFEGVRMNDAS